MNNSTSTLDYLVVTDDSPTGTRVSVTAPNVKRVRLNRRKKGLENAVYTYIQAVRGLGRKHINTVEIADALSLSVDDVNRVVSSLKKKGVKALHVWPH